MPLNTLELSIPFFGICLGMQCAVVDFSKVGGLQASKKKEYLLSYRFDD